MVARGLGWSGCQIYAPHQPEKNRCACERCEGAGRQLAVDDAIESEDCLVGKPKQFRAENWRPDEAIVKAARPGELHDSRNGQSDEADDTDRAHHRRRQADPYGEGGETSDAETQTKALGACAVEAEERQGADHRDEDRQGESEAWKEVGDGAKVLLAERSVAPEEQTCKMALLQQDQRCCDGAEKQADEQARENDDEWVEPAPPRQGED